jgi:hypothetical protein
MFEDLLKSTSLFKKLIATFDDMGLLSRVIHLCWGSVMPYLAYSVISRSSLRVLPLSSVLLLGVMTPVLAWNQPPPVNLVSNGSFELPGAGCVAGSTTLPGWTVTSGNIDIINVTCTGGLPPAQGSYYIDLTGSHAEDGADDVGTISQYITTEIGQKYRLSFEFGGNPQASEFSYPNDSELKAMAVFLNGAIAGAYSVHTAGVAVTNPQWRHKEMFFTATAASTEIRFQSLNGSISNPSDFGSLLDAVSLTVVAKDDHGQGGW